MRTIKELLRADEKELSPTRSDITKECFFHIKQLQAENKRLLEALKKIKTRERGCHRHGLGPYTSWQIANQAIKESEEK